MQKIVAVVGILAGLVGMYVWVFVAADILYRALPRTAPLLPHRYCPVGGLTAILFVGGLMLILRWCLVRLRLPDQQVNDSPLKGGA